jgi:hypothetical protein
MTTKVEELLNMDKYPLDQLDSPRAKNLVSQIRQSLTNDGTCTLPKFVTNNALKTMASQAVSLKDKAYSGPTSVSPYFFNYDLGKDLNVDDQHPLRHKGKRNLQQVAGDLIPPNYFLSVLFYSELMTAFLGRILGTKVYRNQDKYQSLNISLQDEGGCQQWHFDAGDIVTTLLLQAPESGGVFEYCPRIRSEENENFDEVRKVLDGKSTKVKQLHLQAGMLSLFQGHYSIHRVTEVHGSTRRIQAILGYTTKPDLVGSVKSSILHYGPRIALREIKGEIHV